MAVFYGTNESNYIARFADQGDDSIFGWAQSNPVGDFGPGVDNDTLVGGLGNDLVSGGAGDDWVRGGAGQNTLLGGSGNDDIESQTNAADHIFGGAGRDYLSYYGSASLTALTISVADPTHMFTATNGLSFIGIEQLLVIGGALGDSLTGGRFSDTFYGNGGDDSLAGGAGADEIHGGTGADHIAGGGGADLIYGDDGADVVTGGNGNDEFVFSSAPIAGVVDAITDFASGHDQILLYHTLFTGMAVGVLTAENFVLGTAAADASDRILYDQATGALWYDVDGIGGVAAVQFAALVAGTVLTAGDVLIV